MKKDPSPLLGYNNNIRHRNRVFHVQTEDSGVRHPHVITHLFMDGGQILKSVKTSYAEQLGAERMADVVRKMMKDQHKGMLIALRDGQFDAVIDGREKEGSKAPSPPASTDAPDGAPGLDDGADALVLSPTPDHVAGHVPGHVAGHVLGIASDPTVEPTTLPEAIAVLPVDLTAGEAEGIDLATLERAAAETSVSPIFEASRDLKPPPPNLFRQRTGGNYSELNPVAAERISPVPRAPESRPPDSRAVAAARATAPRAASTPPGVMISKSTSVRPPAQPSPTRASVPPAVPNKPPRRSPAGPPAESRYAPARPAAIFGQTRPSMSSTQSSSIFGEDVISDKSLDEVILSYLAEDIEKPKPGSHDPKRRK